LIQQTRTHLAATRREKFVFTNKTTRIKSFSKSPLRRSCAQTVAGLCGRCAMIKAAKHHPTIRSQFHRQTLTGAEHSRRAISDASIASPSMESSTRHVLEKLLQ
jgi:hypothetical protein